MEIIKEKELKNKPRAIPYECTEIILDQMKKNICKIKMKDGSQGTGFFCKIPFPNITFPCKIRLYQHNMAWTRRFCSGTGLEYLQGCQYAQQHGSI